MFDFVLKLLNKAVLIILFIHNSNVLINELAFRVFRVINFAWHYDWAEILHVRVECRGFFVPMLIYTNNG